MKKLFTLQNMVALAIVICFLVLTFFSVVYLQRGGSAPGGEVLLPVIGGLLAACLLTASQERRAKRKNCRLIRMPRKKTTARYYPPVA